LPLASRTEATSVWGPFGVFVVTRTPEQEQERSLSVADVLCQRNAHCLEAAFVAACALWINGYPPFLMNMKAKKDDDHAVTLFRHGKCWGAISKSNHVWLRWRDPVYRNLRELAMSYFHEYVVGSSKSLYAYSKPFDLSRFDPETKVSRRHARIWCEGETFLVEDLGSVNGTVINDSVRLAPRQPRVLDSGDKIRLGETTLHFLVG